MRITEITLLLFTLLMTSSLISKEFMLFFKVSHFIFIIAVAVGTFLLIGFIEKMMKGVPEPDGTSAPLVPDVGSPAPAENFKLLIPFYMYPSHWDGGYRYLDLGTAMSDANGDIDVIINPDALSSPNADWVIGLNDIKTNASVNDVANFSMLYGYVATDETAIPLATAKSVVDGYIADWGTWVEHFYVDNITVDLGAGLTYYTELVNYIKTVSPTSKVILDMRANAPPQYFEIGNNVTSIVTFQGSKLTWDSETVSTYQQDFPIPSRFAANILEAAGLDTAGVNTVVDEAVALNYGKIFLTESSGYSVLTSYLTDLVAKVNAINA